MARRWLSNTGDLVVEHIDKPNGRVRLYYLSTLADASIVYNELIPKLRLLPLETVGIDEVEKQLGVASSNRVYEVQEAVSRMIHNAIYVHVEGAAFGLAIPSDGTVGRSIQAPEVESVVLGPQIAFVEELNVNLCIIRKYMPTTHLFHERLVAGTEIPVDISVLYLENIVDPENVNTVRQRIQELNVDSHLDSSILAQYIADNERSLFPTLQQTERPDRVIHGLRQGQVAILFWR